MADEKLDLQEKIRKLTVKVVKHYRGKGPEVVKVKIEGDVITIDIKGILSNLSEILVEEGAVDIVKSYWRIMKPYLEKEFLDEAYETVGRKFEYSWQIHNLEKDSRSIVVSLNLISDGSIRKKDT
ncbi:DUF2294 domain-containing protein [Clostridium sp. CX1]|uniref:DUF2294 domain-containing protein n=1 Tax=Clostridium tanneri TaxID=3037988 RepID=A0ABU4JXI3_9CLOT|nr:MULTISPECIES: DUF2294 domain-containing protein [unclassified Clostridium]MCT8978639.1 DUF2294 domain-containing protein [Clostridium sp. CX1]MDW8802850.1 DUF2294 domain-containing protein [Clostridium sp. A1-XYC3]